MVYAAVKDSPEMQQVLRSYNLLVQAKDAEGNPEYSGETPVYEEIPLEKQRLAAEEYLARMAETGGTRLGDVYLQHKAEIDTWGREHGFDAHNLDETQKMVEAWMEETGFAPEKPGWFKQLCARIRTWLRMHGFKSANTISDDEIMTIIARAAQAEIRNRRYRDLAGGERYMAPLRPDNAPNNAESGMALRDNNVPYAPGFMEWAGLEGDGLYADYEFLYAKHWTKAGKSPYFSSPEMAQAATELVLAAPEKVKDINENMSFVGRDEETGKIYRIEIQKQVKGKRNHIRSVFEITQKQYEKCKLETSPVLQLSPTGTSAGRTISSILKKNLARFSQNANPDAKNNGTYGTNETVRASVTPEEDAAYLDAVRRGDLDAALKMAEDAAVNAGAQKFTNPKLAFHLIANAGVPVDLVEEISSWKIQSQSPYSYSFYNTDKKTWDYTPEGCLRVSDHWNFKSMGKTHCVTDVPVKTGYWTLAEYHDGIWHVIKSEKGIGKWYGGKKELKEVTKDNVNKAFPKLDIKSLDYLYDFAKDKNTGEVLGKIIGAVSPTSNKYKIQGFDGTVFEKPYYEYEEIGPWEMKEAGGFVFFPGTNTIKSTGVTYDDDGNVIPLSQRFDREKTDVRFSAGVMDEETSRFTAMFQPLVGAHLDLSGEDYAALLRNKYGIDIPPARAKLYAKLAIEANTAERFRNYAKQAMEYFRTVNPLFDFMANFTGSESFTVNPGEKHLGEDFSGSFIDPDYKKYSRLREQRAKESAKQYKRYRDSRDEKLKNAGGYKISELAEAYARQTGRDALEVEEEMLDFLRDFKKTDIRTEYRKFREEDMAQNRAAADEQRAIFEEAQRQKVNAEIEDMLQRGLAIDRDWIAGHRATFKELYRRYFNKEAGSEISNSDLEALNDVLLNKNPDAPQFAAIYKALRGKAYSELSQRYKVLRESDRKAAYAEYMEDFKSFRDSVMQDHIDFRQLQNEAARFAERNVDKAR